MRLSYQTLAAGKTDEQTLFAVTAAPGSRDAQALAELVTLAHHHPVDRNTTFARPASDLSPPAPPAQCERPLPRRGAKTSATWS
jgi:hypothetical protein